MAPKSIEVNILGKVYTLKGDADEEYIRSLANHVDARIKDLYQRNPTINPLKAAIMVAINLTDQLFQSQKSQDDTNELLSRKVQALSNLLEV